MKSKFCTDKKSGKNQPSVKKKRKSTELVKITLFCTKKKQFRSETFSWYAPTNGKTFLQGRLLTMSELMIRSVSDYSKTLPQLVFRCCETRWRKACFCRSPLLRRNCSVCESTTRFRLLKFRHWDKCDKPQFCRNLHFKKKQRASCLVHCPSRVSIWCPTFENWNSFDLTVETRWGI